MLHEDVDGVVQVEFVTGAGRQGGSVDLAGGVEVFGGLAGPFGPVRDGPSGVGGDGQGAGERVQGEAEAAGVDDGVMAGAGQDQVGQVGAAAVAPFDDMVGVEFAAAGAGGVAAAFTVDGAEQVT